MDATAADRAVLFDATGTLIEVREPVGETYAHFADAAGGAISAWRLGDAFGRVVANAPERVFPSASRDEAARLEREAWRTIVRQTFLAADSATGEALADACFDALFAHYGRGDAWRLREGARDALFALHDEGVATAVVSNFDQRLPGILDGLGVGPAIDLVWLPVDAGVAKPDPAIFASALRRLGVAPGRALFVGDDAERDLAGARAAGMRAVDATSLATLADLPARFAREIPKEPLR